MTAHHHDPDLILALAEGTLPAPDVAPAAAEVAGCDRCTEDLAAQRTALAALATLSADPAARLTDLEAQRLHRSLHEQTTVPVDDPVPARPAPARRRSLGWGPLVTAAAVFLAVVVGGNALRSLGGGDDDSGPETLAVDATGTPLEDAAGGAGDDAEAQAPSTAAAEMLAATTAAPSADSGTAMSGDGTPAPDTAAPTVDDLAVVWASLLTDPARSTVSEELPADPEELATDVSDELGLLTGGTATTSASVDGIAVDSCVGAAAAFLDGPVETVVVGTFELADLGPTVVTVSTAPDGTANLLLHDPDGCTVVAEVVAGHP